MASVSDDDVAMKPPAASESTTQPSTTVPDNEAESNTEKDIAASASAAAAAASDPNTTTNNNSTNNMTVISLGGKRSQKSFAILDGVFQDPESDEKERVTIDITRLPALLGRSNESDKDDPNFFGLGKKKALSRKHCTIYYRDKEGGHAEWDTTAQTTIYKDVETVGAKKSPPKPNPHPVKDDGDGDETKEGDGLPPNGFFVIECLGKNRILVDRTRVEQGESMVLRSGSAIRISSYMFYFLLPADAEPKPHLIELPLSDEEKEKAAATAAAASTKHKGGKKKPSSATKAAKKRSSISSSKHKSSGKDKTNTTGTKKASGSASKKRPVPTIALSAMKKPKKAGTNSATTTLAELEVLPVEELIEKMDDAVSKGLWDRKNQFIGATVCYHAVRSAGAAIPIQEKVLTGAGVSRSDIMEWIEQSDMYGGWVQQMLTNMEPRSYQAAVTKSLLKSGFTRTSGAGRYIKWLIPDDIPMKVKAGKKKKTKSKSDEGKTTKPKPKPKPQPIESVSSKEKDDEGDNETGDENDNDSDDDDDDDDGSNSDHQPGETPNKEEGADEEEEEEEEEEEDASGNDAGMEDDNNEADENEDESDANEEEDGNEEEIEDDDDDTNKNKDNNNCNNDNAEEEDEQSDDNAEESDMDITF